MQEKLLSDPQYTVLLLLLLLSVSLNGQFSPELLHFRLSAWKVNIVGAGLGTCLMISLLLNPPEAWEKSNSTLWQCKVWRSQAKRDRCEALERRGLGMGVVATPGMGFGPRNKNSKIIDGNCFCKLRWSNLYLWVVVPTWTTRPQLQVTRPPGHKKDV